MRYKLIAEQHDDLGDVGAVITYPTQRLYHDPVWGTGIAHDILHHPVTPHEDPFIDELIALGANTVAYDLTSYGWRVEDMLADELLRLFAELPDSLTYLSQYKCNTTIRDSRFIRIFDKAIKAGLKNYTKEYGGVFADDVDQSLVAGWLCRGYQLFRKRFPALHHYDICDHLFKSIATEVDSWLAEAHEGCKADLKIDFRRCYAELTPSWE